MDSQDARSALGVWIKQLALSTQDSIFPLALANISLKNNSTESVLSRER